MVCAHKFLIKKRKNSRILNSNGVLGDNERSILKVHLYSGFFWGRVKWPALVTWPDLTRSFFNQNARIECLGKVTKYELDICKRFRMAQENPQGTFKHPPPRNRVKSHFIRISRACWLTYGCERARLWGIVCATFGKKWPDQFRSRSSDVITRTASDHFFYEIVFSAP